MLLLENPKTPKRFRMVPDEFLRWNVLFLTAHPNFFLMLIIYTWNKAYWVLVVYNINQHDFDGNH